MLSARQQDTYRFIRDYIARHGRAPLLDEVARGLGIRSRGVVHRYVQALAEEGLLALQPGRHRGIRLTDEAQAQPSLPLLGKIAAGLPIEAIQGEEEVNLAEFFMGPNRFLLKVQGESMIEAAFSTATWWWWSAASKPPTATSWWPSSTARRRPSSGCRTTATAA